MRVSVAAVQPYDAMRGRCTTSWSGRTIVDAMLGMPVATYVSRAHVSSFLARITAASTIHGPTGASSGTAA